MKNKNLRIVKNILLYLISFVVTVGLVYLMLDFIRMKSFAKESVSTSFIRICAVTMAEILIFVSVIKQSNILKKIFLPLADFEFLEIKQLVLHGIFLGSSIVLIYSILWDLTSLIEYLAILKR